MGWTFYSVESLPKVHDIVWCKWPQREDKGMPGKVTRPTLVREVEVLEHPQIGKFGRLLVSYASGEHINEQTRLVDLIIEDWAAVRAAGLHNPTRFSLNPRDRWRLPWCQEYFVGQEYAPDSPIVAGSLTEAQSDTLRQLLKRHGLTATA
jgi:hypothetical protein